MKEIRNENIKRYMYNDFVVTLIEQENKFEAWLAHVDYGVSSLMFGMPKYQPADNVTMTFPDFLEMVEVNLDEEIEVYMDLYMN